jgi:hypothetical protein
MNRAGCLSPICPIVLLLGFYQSDSRDLGQGIPHARTGIPNAGHLIPLAFLAPDIVAGILSGTQPVDLTTETLTKRIDISLGWAEQEALLGFTES